MTNLGRTILAWLFRHLLSLLLILTILIVARYALPPALAWWKSEAAAARSIPARSAAYSLALRRYDAWSERHTGAIRTKMEALGQAPDQALRTRRAAIGPEMARHRQARLSGLGLAAAAAGGQADRLFEHYRAGAEIALLEREAAFIDALLAARSTAGRQSNLQSRRAAAVRQVRASYQRWRDAQGRIAALNARPMAGPRNFLCRSARPGVGCNNYRALVAARAERDRAAADNRDARRTIEAIDRMAASIGTARAQAMEASAAIATQRRAIAAQLEAVQGAARGNWILRARGPIVEMLPTALLILAGAIFAPMLVKAFLYFVVAPAAARRPPIRLVPGEAGEATMANASSPSQSIRLAPGEELLVVPEAVQSTPHDADKATRWLLSWSMPLSSVASGMVALVRVRPRVPDFVQVAATGNPLAEVALVAIGEGSAMVLSPRALRGLVRPVGTRTQISRHWRFGHLSAWLTLQFRYLVFHGPCTLIVQGTRGVRLEPAGPGRGINQASTIGFSAGLAYSVRRSEAFGAYLIGKQDLFNDSFRSAGGWYLYEQMPREGERTGLWGRGVRGLGDGVLNAFGI